MGHEGVVCDAAPGTTAEGSSPSLPPPPSSTPYPLPSPSPSPSSTVVVISILFFLCLLVCCLLATWQFSEGLEVQVEELIKDLAAARATEEGARKAKSLFLGSVSHEIRTPLNGVIGECC